MIRLALALCLVALPASAQDANTRAEKEAKIFLRSCSLVSQVFREYCGPDQKQFIESYIMAKSGQTYFMGDVVGHLDPTNSNLQLGVVIDRHEACAWRMVRADLSARGKVVVMERATAIFLELKAAPTTPLPSLSDYPKTPPLPPLLKKP